MTTPNPDLSLILDSNQQILLPVPTTPKVSLKDKILFRLVFPLLGPIFVSYQCLIDSVYRTSISSIYSLVSSASSSPISSAPYYQDPTLLSRLWKMDSARAYINEQGEPQLEYQLREGYCGSATMRCILRSLGFGGISEQKSGESKPEKWCEHVNVMVKESMHGEEVKVETEIVEGGVNYEEFVKKMRDGLGKKNCRVACNFLRPVLFGFPGWRIFPMNFLIGIMGGHFSPILGVLDLKEDEYDKYNIRDPLVAVFDVNHKYNGVYFVPARRLYDSVHAFDVSSNKRRALVLVEKARFSGGM